MGLLMEDCHGLLNTCDTLDDFNYPMVILPRTGFSSAEQHCIAAPSHAAYASSRYLLNRLMTSTAFVKKNDRSKLADRKLM
jgi:hypothetical protein